MIINTDKLHNLKPWQYCLFGGLLLGLILLALKGDAYAKLDPFPAAQFSQSPADFLGNQYVLRAQIDANYNGIRKWVVYWLYFRIKNPHRLDFYPG